MSNLTHKTRILQYSPTNQKSPDRELYMQVGGERTSDKASNRPCIIPYHPRLGTLLGSVYAALFLQQAYHRFRNNGDKPFYKFLAPCSSDYYRRGDSWVEELSFTFSQLKRAIRTVATRISSTRKSQGTNKNQVLSVDRVELNTTGTMSNSSGLVLYWTKRDRRTWWMVNLPLFSSLLEAAYVSNMQNDHQEIDESSIRLFDNSTIRFPHAEITNIEKGTAAPQNQFSTSEEHLLQPKISHPHESLGLNEYARTIADSCSITLHLCSNEIADEVLAAARSLVASRCSLEEIVLVGHWWKSHFWKGQRGTPPRPNDLLDMYGAAEDFYSNEKSGDCCLRFIGQWRFNNDLEAERVSRGD